MNELSKRRIILEYWIWEPFDKLVRKDEDEILCSLKEGKILPHAGYAKIFFEDVSTKGVA